MEFGRISIDGLLEHLQSIWKVCKRAGVAIHDVIAALEDGVQLEDIVALLDVIAAFREKHSRDLLPGGKDGPRMALRLMRLTARERRRVSERQEFLGEYGDLLSGLGGPEEVGRQIRAAGGGGEEPPGALG